MTDFYYTDLAEPDSSLVHSAAYHRDTQELAVDLGGAVYVYTGVPFDVFRALSESTSPGRYFQTIKHSYGPSDCLGHNWNVNLVEDQQVAPEDEVFTAGAVGTPKDLKYAEGAHVNNVTVIDKGDYYDLRPITNENDTEGVQDYEYEVVFTVGEADDERSYSTQAGSVDEAMANLHEVGEMLGLDFCVKRVTVHF